MKKILAIMVALILVCACASAMAELKFSTGGPAGTYFAFGNTLGTFIGEQTGLQVTAITSDGSSANIYALDEGTVQLGFAQSDVANYAFSGINQFEDDQITSFKALCALYTETVQIVTDDPEIKTVADLKGKAVSIGAPGSGVTFNAKDFLAAYDMTIDDIDAQYLGFDDSAEALKDGKIDAFFCVAGAPTPAIVDLCATKGAYLVSVDEEHIAKLKEICGAYVGATIPGGTYSTVPEDVVTVGVKAIIIANDDVSEEDAYTIVSTIFENKDAITELHAKGAELDVEYASECGLPYNAGAAKYFEEKGFTVQQ